MTERPATATPDADDAGEATDSGGNRQLGGAIKRVALASAVAQAVTQGVTLLQTVVLARLLSPAEVGIFAAGTVLTAFLANFSEGGMRAGLVQREGDVRDAAETVFLATILTGLLMSLGALAAAPVIGLVFASPVAGMVAAVSSGSLLLYSITNVPEAMLQRSFSVKRRLIVGPAVSISFAVTAVIMAAQGFGVWSLVAGSYASYLALVVTVWVLTDWRPGRGHASWQEWRRLARFGFPIVMGFVGAKGQQLVEAVVVGRGLSTAALGFYRYGLRISRVPVDATLEIVAVALFPAFSRIAHDRERLRASYLEALSGVTFFATAVSGLIISLGEPAVVVLLGEPWRGAGVAVVAMAGLGLGKAFTSVSEEAIKGAGRTGLLNWLTGTEVVLGIGLLVLIIPFGLFGVGLAISTTALSVGIVCLCLARSVVGTTLRQVAAVLTPPLLSAAVAGVASAALERTFFHSDARPVIVGLGLLTLDTIVFVAVYLGVLWLLAPSVVRAVLARLRRSPGV